MNTGFVSDLSAAIDDDIVARRVLPAIVKIRELLGCGIPAALDELQQRYDRLRMERADEFTVSPEEYGRGIYT
jgi:hypothetical protein